MSSNVNDKGTYHQKFIFLTYIKSEKINHLPFLWENHHGEYIPGEFVVDSEQMFAYALGKKCPYSPFFSSVFPRVRTEYGDLQSKYPLSSQLRENAGQKKLRIYERFPLIDRVVIIF